MAGSHSGGHDETAHADGSNADGSRIEAAEAGAHDSHEPGATHPTAQSDDGAGHGGHGADPNAGVLVAEPPPPAWVLTAAGIALVTALVMGVLGVILHDADAGRGDSGHGAESGTEAPAEPGAGTPAEAPAEAPAHGMAPTTLTNARV